MKPGTSDIDIRTDLRPGDIGAIIQMHGTLYGSEHGFGVQFDSYVALGLHEFYAAYDPGRDRVWICEHDGRMIASMLLMHPGERHRTAQVLPDMSRVPGHRRSIENTASRLPKRNPRRLSERRCTSSATTSSCRTSVRGSSPAFPLRAVPGKDSPDPITSTKSRDTSRRKGPPMRGSSSRRTAARLGGWNPGHLLDHHAEESPVEGLGCNAARGPFGQ